MQNRPPIPVIILVILVVVGGAGFFLYSELQKNTVSLALTASGTVEAVQVDISPEIAGKVTEVLVQEGDTVKAGDVLFRLDDTLLQAQRAQADTALASARLAAQTADAAQDTAQASYDLALFTAANEAQNGRVYAWATPAPSDFNQPTWYFSRPEQLKAAQTQAAAAQATLQEKQQALDFVQQKAASAPFLAAEKRLELARLAYQVAQDVLKRAGNATSNKDIKDAAQANFDDAEQELKDAQQAYTDAQTSEGAKDITKARAELTVAQETSDATQDRLRQLQVSSDSPKVISAAAALNQAKAAAAQAHAAVDQAQASLKVLDTQLARYTIAAPAAGVIYTRTVEPGEVVNPGSVAFTIGRLEDLTITVYIPENRYGEVSLGQSATVQVDSFAGQKFKASVSRIADQAEFTPRNVQTVEGRSSTVFAVVLKVTNTDAKLKSGMPADVTFQ
jgi:multidrug efflux pump subunit AcrA (membrane-fusion protein)